MILLFHRFKLRNFKKMKPITHLVNFGFGEIAIHSYGFTLEVIKSDDPMMPEGTIFPLRDIKRLDADFIALY
ncbi:hypothetical protein UGMREWDR_CDS0186 [Aeromonas phage GomatiRiver_11]|nr:hypothetical protein UGMREWDR_CDS0186 [Aeromonas phage GomatiRiver_11]